MRFLSIEKGESENYIRRRSRSLDVGIPTSLDRLRYFYWRLQLTKKTAQGKIRHLQFHGYLLEEQIILDKYSTCMILFRNRCHPRIHSTTDLEINKSFFFPQQCRWTFAFLEFHDFSNFLIILSIKMNQNTNSSLFFILKSVCVIKNRFSPNSSNYFENYFHFMTLEIEFEPFSIIKLI